MPEVLHQYRIIFLGEEYYGFFEMDAEEFEEEYPDYEGQIEHLESIPARGADTVRPQEVLDNEIADKIPFDSLYSHQAEALNELENRNNVCITTPTSSGKTLVYALHIAREVKKDEDSTALLIYPTKALSRDQESELESLYDELGISIDIGVYDGDSSSDEKRRIRRESDVIISNFQGLNYYLPYHEKWSRIFRNLSTVVIDEAHTYTGVQGMHVAWINRRIRRLVENEYGKEPLYILSSATIGNPEEHSKNLVGQNKNFSVIDKDGSPRGRRDIIIWNPPSYMDEDEGNLKRRSPHRESTDILSFLASRGKQSLMFAPSRKMTELCAKWSEETLKDDYAGFYDVESYNAGHRQQDRREVESKLKSGELDAVVSTTALELGIDIGDVDSTIMDGYPGRRASFWQQAGRSGRGTNDALSFLVTRHDSIDQFIVNNPDFLLEEDVENAVIDLDNTHVLSVHLLAAANEKPITNWDRFPYNGVFGDGKIDEVVKQLRSEGLLAGDYSDGIRYTGDSGRPESNIDLYATSDEQFSVYIDMGDDEFELPPADKTRAFRDFHPNAIYMYKGNQYEVTEFDRENREIKLEYTEVGYYTQSNRNTEIKNIEVEDSKEITEDAVIKKGTATIAESYSTYTRVYFNEDRREANIPTGLNDPIELETEVMWIEFSTKAGQDIAESAAVDGLPGSLHAAEHAMIKMSPTIITADSKDLGGLSTPTHGETGLPTIFIYDGVEGGVGFSHEIYNQVSRLSSRTEKMLEECECESDHGCPACTMSPMCGDNNEPMDSVGAVRVLEYLQSS